MRSFFLLPFTLLSACLTSLSRPAEKRTPRIRAVTRRSQQSIAEQSVDSSRQTGRSLYFLPSAGRARITPSRRSGNVSPTEWLACSQRCEFYRHTGNFARRWQSRTMGLLVILDPSRLSDLEARVEFLLENLPCNEGQPPDILLKSHFVPKKDQKSLFFLREAEFQQPV